MSKKRFHESRAQEARDFAMISEDRSAIANLPQDVKYHAWPKTGPSAQSSYEDTIKGIDKQMDEDDSGAKRRKGGFKY